MKRALLLVVGGAVLGCQPHYDGLRVRVNGGGGDVRGSRIEVTEGQALIITVRPESSNAFEDYEDFNIVTLESFNENVVEAATADEIDRFVLIGTGVGRTSIDVLIDGVERDVLEAEVVAQTGGP